MFTSTDEPEDGWEGLSVRLEVLSEKLGWDYGVVADAWSYARNEQQREPTEEEIDAMVMRMAIVECTSGEFSWDSLVCPLLGED